MFTSGPLSQPIKFQSRCQLSISLYSPLTHCGLSPPLLFRSQHSFPSPASVFIPGCRRRLPLSASTNARLFFSPLFLSALPCFINDASHAFASRTGNLPFFGLAYKLERRGLKVVQKSDHGRLTSMKTQMPISPAVTASIHYIGCPSLAALLIYLPSYCVVPCVTDRCRLFPL